MNIIIIFSSIMFSVFATAIMSYVSMATPIGPWVELITVLAATLFFRLVCGYVASERLKNAVGLTTAAAGIAGIVATVCGFTVPTLHFLDPELFRTWLAHPLDFTAIIGGCILVGGCYALIMVSLFGERMLVDEKLAFPIGQMVHKMILAQNQLRKALELCAGIVLTFGYAFMQRCSGWLPQKLFFPAHTFFNVMHVSAISIRLDLLPLFVAIGYVAGDILTVPLAVGALSKVMLLEPLNRALFAHVIFDEFILAFGAGMMVQGAILSFAKLPQLVMTTIKKFSGGEFIARRRWRKTTIALFIAFFVMSYAYFSYFNMSLIAQLYMFAFTALCVYQLMVIGGKIGLAPFGRFATFVMLPGFLMFGYDSTQVMLVSLFVSLSGGIAVDMLFGRKMAQLSDINKKEIIWMQILGLVVSACVFGYIFTQLAHSFGLGSAELVAQRARARALLLNVHTLNYVVVALGCLFGWVLERVGVNVLLVFTGLLFPVDFSLMLILGGMLTYVAQDKEEWDPFWSGVFAAASLWMVLRGFL